MYVADEQIRVFCLPHAGGSAIAYRQWDDRSPAGVLVRPIELPGHGLRMSEALVDDFDRLTRLLAEEIIAETPGRYALFGHSLGALLAFELARTLRHTLGEPAALLVSGRNGPSVPSAGPLLHNLSDDLLLRGLDAFGGTPRQMLSDPDLRGIFLPIIRTDLKLAETYVRGPGERLRCPVSVYAGRHDPLVTEEGLAAWRRECAGPVDIRRFDGAHFFLAGQDFPAAFLGDGELDRR